MQPSTLLLPATFAANRRPSPPPPPLPLPLGRHHHGQTCRHSLQKKEATAAAAPAYQWQHQRENIYKFRRLDLFDLSTVSREFSNYQVVSLKNLYLFYNLHTRRCLALYFWELSRNKKAFHVNTYVGFLQLSGGKKAIFLASLYS
jgi:hypothetical protein